MVLNWVLTLRADRGVDPYNRASARVPYPPNQLSNYPTNHLANYSYTFPLQFKTSLILCLTMFLMASRAGRRY